MTPSFDPAKPGAGRNFFRPAEHVLVLPEGSAIAILDLERGVMYATTPVGAESWSRLVGDKQPPRRKMGKPGEPDEDEDRRAWARVAGYLIDRRIIEPIAG